jgi:predicted kinase
MKKIPLHSLIIMVGPAGAGKSTVAAANFESYEIVSSDEIRNELTGDIQRQDFNSTVFRELYHRVSVKLDMGERVVVDATNLRKSDRMGLTNVGMRYGVPIYYIVVQRPLAEKLKTAGWRNDVDGLVERHHELFLREERDILFGDSIATVVDLRKEEFEVVQKPPMGDLEAEIAGRGFKGVMVIPDVHGMNEALKSAIEWATARNLFMIFLGDVVDYGPHSLECVSLVYDIVTRGRGVMVVGNHEHKIRRWMDQQRTGDLRLRLSTGNLATTNKVEALAPDERRRWEAKFACLMNLGRHHFVVGNTLFAHGGAEPEMFEMQGHRLSDKFENIALFGEVDSVKRTRGDGYPNRIYDWVDRIPAGKQVIVGHDIRSEIKPLAVEGSLGGTAVFMDTGSGKGGRLTTADIFFQGEPLKIQNFKSH